MPVTSYLKVVFVAQLLSTFVSAQATQTVKLPWNTYTNTSYEPSGTCVGIHTSHAADCGNFYTFENVRFGAPPTRFTKASLPDTDPPSNAHNCYVTPASLLKCNSSSDTDSESDARPPFGGLLPEDVPAFSEDCLFADIYVPAEAFPISENSTKFPVVVWFYGGAYIFGSKGGGELPFYNPTGLYRTGYSGDQRFVFVVPNYRLGAWGWLAGDDFASAGGTPNLGLWDQRLALDFVNQYIDQFGGDNNKVSLWGESAGAGSILHHLTSTDPPNVWTAVMQSPAFPLQWDPTSSGYASGIYQSVTDCATQQPSWSCNGSQTTFECLQQLDTEDFWYCSNQTVLSEWSQKGLFAFGPTVDSTYIDHLPSVALLDERVTNVSAMIISHVADEASHFVPCFIPKSGTDQTEFDAYINNFLGSKYSFLANNISNQYPPGNYKTVRDRAIAVIQDSGFTCNTRYVYDAYSNGTDADLYMLQYAFLAEWPYYAAVHASDLFPTFYNDNINETAVQILIENVLPGFFSHFPKTVGDVVSYFLAIEFHLAQEYQYYLASFAANGKPAAGPYFPSPSWEPVTGDADILTDMKAYWNVPFLLEPFRNISDFTTSADTENTYSTCSFWQSIATRLESAVITATTPIATLYSPVLPTNIVATPLVLQDAKMKLRV